MSTNKVMRENGTPGPVEVNNSGAITNFDSLVQKLYFQIVSVLGAVLWVGTDKLVKGWMFMTHTGQKILWIKTQQALDTQPLEPAMVGGIQIAEVQCYRLRFVASDGGEWLYTVDDNGDLVKMPG